MSEPIKIQPLTDCKHDRTVNEGDPNDVILYCFDCQQYLGGYYPTISVCKHCGASKPVSTGLCSKCGKF